MIQVLNINVLNLWRGRLNWRMRMKKLALVFLACSLWSQVPLPETTAARRFSQWLEVFNRGQGAELGEFLEKSFPSQKPERAIAARQQSGGFDLQKVEESSETKFVGIAKGRNSGRTVKITLNVEAAEPHRILGMILQPVAGVA